jgi:hypothetical protein
VYRLLPHRPIRHAAGLKIAYREARRRGLGKVINVIAYTGNAHAPVPHPCGTSEANARFGTLGSLDSLFDCPNVVKHVLCDNNHLNAIFLVGSDSDVDDIFGQTGIRLLFSPTKRHSKTVSR